MEESICYICGGDIDEDEGGLLTDEGVAHYDCLEDLEEIEDESGGFTYSTLSDEDEEESDDLAEDTLNDVLDEIESCH